MNDPFEHLIRKSSEDISLTTEERAKVRALLAEYTAMKPVRVSRASRALPSFIYAFVRPALAGTMVFLVLLAGTGGITYAAEGSLPGDLLYGVKIRVTEPVVSALTSSGGAQARWQMTLAERRVHEAATLAKAGRLDTPTETVLATHFTVAADAAAAAVAEEPDPVSATVAVAGFVPRLAAYDTVLSQSADGSGSTKALRTAVKAQRGSWHDEDEVAASTSSPTRRRASVPTDIAKLERKARAAIHDSADTVGQATVSLNASSTQGANEALQQATDFAEEGHARLKQHDEKGASKAFRASIGASARLDVLTRAASILKIDAFEHTGDGKDDDHDDTASPNATSTPADSD